MYQRAKAFFVESMEKRHYVSMDGPRNLLPLPSFDLPAAAGADW
jgi:hypothetical protein